MNWQDKRIKLYIEAGLAVLLVLTLGLAGAAGVLSTRADDGRIKAEAETADQDGSSKTEGETGSRSEYSEE